MKTLGLIGGTSWHSTVDYYRAINTQVNARLGGMHSARLLLYSVNFEELRPPADPAGWQEIAAKLAAIARKLETAGAECLVLCANTPHVVADQVQEHIAIPLLHIAEATARAISEKRLASVGLLGTRFTMEQPFFKERLARAGITALVPDDNDRHFLHESIFGELTHGVFKPETRQAYLDIIRKLVARGAEGVILGCTEIPMLLGDAECGVPAFDTTLLHASAAVDFALGDKPLRR
jgi:aspartate racemase